MRNPAGVSRIVRLPIKVALLACLLPAVTFPADAVRPIRAAGLASVPRYDPAIREQYLAGQAARAAAPTPAAPKPKPVLMSSPAPMPGSTDGTLVLDRMVVHPDRAARRSPPPLPRTSSFAPLRDIPGEPFESGSARDARLVRKHLGSFGQALSRLPYFGGAVIAGARQAEVELTKAQDLNRIADSTELAALSGQDAEITRKVRAEYLKLYYSGPPK